MMKKTRVAIYVRVSTQEQAKEGYSIGEQSKRLKKFAEAHDWIVVKVYVDAGHSGANTDRPALQEMISAIEDGKIDKVLVYKLDRLSRSQKDTLKLIEDVFLQNDCDFESMSEKLDTSTAQGRLFLGILAAFAQLEREMISERMSMGLDARIKEGKWRGGAHVAFGYDYDKESGQLKVNDYESMIIKEIFDLFSQGRSIHQIQEHMMKTGHLFRNGKADKRSIRYALQNKTYCGFQRRKGEWIKGLHTAIIDEETYNNAQIILQENLKRFEEFGYKTGTNAVSTCLGGLIYCAKCGAKYSKNQLGTKGYYYMTYGCYSRHKKVKSMIKDPNCKNKYYKVPELDEIIFNEIRKLAIDPEYIHSLKHNDDKVSDAQKLHAIEKQINQINSQLSRFMDLYGLGKYDIDQLDEKMQPLNDQKLKLQKEKDSLMKENNIITEEQVQKLVSNFDEVIEHGDLLEKRAIIEQLIKKIEIDDDIVTIHWNFV